MSGDYAESRCDKCGREFGYDPMSFNDAGIPFPTVCYDCLRHKRDLSTLYWFVGIFCSGWTVGLLIGLWIGTSH